MNMRSKEQYIGRTRSLQRAWIKGAGLTDEEVENEELDRRRGEYQPPEPRVKRGYLKHYADQVAPATKGAVMPR